MIYFEKRHVRIHWDDSLAAVWAEWLSFVESDEFRAALNAGTKLVEEKRAKRWLADTRNLGPVSQEDQEWTTVDWFPRVIRAGVRSMAFVVPRKVVAQLAVQRVMNKIDKDELHQAHFAELAE